MHTRVSLVCGTHRPLRRQTNNFTNPQTWIIRVALEMRRAERRKKKIKRLQLITCNSFLVHLSLGSTFREIVNESECVCVWCAVISKKLLLLKWTEQGKKRFAGEAQIDYLVPIIEDERRQPAHRISFMCLEIENILCEIKFGSDVSSMAIDEAMNDWRKFQQPKSEPKTSP